MKNIILFFVLFLGFTQLADAGWYYTGTNKIYNVGTTNCSADQVGSKSSLSIVGGAAPISGTMYCWGEDTTLPSSLSLSYLNGWTKTAQTITTSALDNGGSGLAAMIIQQSINGGAWSEVSRRSFGPRVAVGTVQSHTWSRSVSDGNNFKYRLVVDDHVGNRNWIDISNIIRFDTTAPTVTHTYAKDNIWTHAAGSVTLSPADIGGSGVKETRYCVGVGCNPTILYTGPISVSPVTNSVIRYRAWDNLSNVSAVTAATTATIKIENIIPSSLSLSYFNGWTNSAQGITAKALDLGGSGLQDMILEQSTNGGPWTESGVPRRHFSAPGPVGALQTHTFNRTPVNGNTYKYRLVVDDYTRIGGLGNQSSINGSNIIRFDTIAPDVPTINSSTHTDGDWTNNTSASFTITANGEGPSPHTTYYCKDMVDTCNPASTYTVPVSYTGLSDGIHYFRAKTCDTGGCSAPSSFVVKIDTIDPNPADITDTTDYDGGRPGHHLLAKSFQTINVVGSNAGGSPIVKMQGYFELDTNPASYNSILTTSNGTFTNPTPYSLEIVDIGTERVAGARTYSYKITYIEDDAGNKLGIFNDPTPNSNIKTIDYMVYASTALPATSTSGQVNLTNPSNIADGDEKILTITLEDTFGNEIVPATGISRTIDFNMYYTETLKLNQYKKTGNAVFVKAPEDTAFNPLAASHDGQGSTDGTYEFGYKVYTSTSTQDPFTVAGSIFNIDRITYDVNGTWQVLDQSIVGSTVPIVSQFKPLFTSAISNHPGMTGGAGFIANASQTGGLAFNGGCSVGCTNLKTYIEFGEGIAHNSVPYVDLTLMAPVTNPMMVNEGIATGDYPVTIIPTVIDTPQVFATLLTQSGGFFDVSNAYISSHISYDIPHPNGGVMNVVLNGDIIGLNNNYWGSTQALLSTQVGLKALGNTQSQSQTDITAAQSTEITVLGKNEKSILKQEIRSNAYRYVKSVTPNNGGQKISNISSSVWSSIGNDGVILGNKNVLYFGSDGVNDNIEIEGGTTFEGKKTIVIVGKNLYIKTNIEHLNPLADILGIIVLKDENGNGGNIYVDPDVTKIHAVMYADKSVISYRGGELDGSTNQYVLKNQLYIHGSLFSENTMGGSVIIPPKTTYTCPYYLDATDCDEQIEAQKYDLNFLRRYALSDTTGDGIIDYHDQSMNNGMSAYGSLPFILDPGHDNYKYPLVIEYNPTLQLTPPPLFNE